MFAGGCDHQGVALAVDTSRAIRTPFERRALVDAVRDAPEHEPETDWIEWKSGLVLASAECRFAIGKYTIGSGNRQPDRAAQFVGGCGYMLIGSSRKR